MKSYYISNRHSFVEYSKEEEAKKAQKEMNGTKIQDCSCRIRLVNRYSRIYYNKRKVGLIPFIIMIKQDPLIEEINKKYEKNENIELENNNSSSSNTYNTRSRSRSRSQSPLKNNHTKHKEIDNGEKEKETLNDLSIINNSESHSSNHIKYFCVFMVDLFIFPTINTQFQTYGEVLNIEYFKNKNDENKWYDHNFFFFFEKKKKKKKKKK